MIRAVVVDDHAVVRSGIKLLLDREDDIEVVGEAGNAKDAIFRARALQPDVILLDVVMPGESGIDVLPALLKESPATRVVVLSMQDDPSYVREAFAAGANSARDRTDPPQFGPFGAAVGSDTSSIGDDGHCGATL